jgi:DNA-binding transcriptional MerR regulator
MEVEVRTQIATNHTELARLCGVSPATISRHIDQGAIPEGEVRLGKRWLYSPTQVEAIVRFFSERSKGETLGKYKYDVSEQPGNN